MFVLRSLFWLALVALMMPRGPDLGLDRARDALSAQPAAYTLQQPRGRRIWDAGRAAHDPLQAYRQLVLGRLDAVRAELATDGPRLPALARFLTPKRRD